ncbi:YndM family protein [Neobacillus terrae]|uniref:YndM family protein n=1 Tax=Neobacillus terrae TaxID=3034837 RepID=UPI00140959A5|nr:YndM family protein [Neobacillus terrae]NHM33040.1 YndM family protein [Neobacillus terrae]
MRHALAFAIKFIATLSVLGLILGLFYNMSFGDILTATIILGLVGYVLGDLFILQRSTNLMATIADFVLAFVVVWFVAANMTTIDNIFSASLISALGVAVFEYFFHRFVPDTDMEQASEQRNQGPKQMRPQYQTEASRELRPVSLKKEPLHNEIQNYRQGSENLSYQTEASGDLTPLILYNKREGQQNQGQGQGKQQYQSNASESSKPAGLEYSSGLSQDPGQGEMGQKYQTEVSNEFHPVKLENQSQNSGNENNGKETKMTEGMENQDYPTAAPNAYTPILSDTGVDGQGPMDMQLQYQPAISNLLTPVRPDVRSDEEDQESRK